MNRTLGIADAVNKGLDSYNQTRELKRIEDQREKDQARQDELNRRQDEQYQMQHDEAKRHMEQEGVHDALKYADMGMFDKAMTAYNKIGEDKLTSLEPHPDDPNGDLLIYETEDGRGGTIDKRKLKQFLGIKPQTYTLKPGETVYDARTNKPIANNPKPSNTGADLLKLKKYSNSLTDDAVKILQSYFGGRFEGGVYFPDEENKDTGINAMAIAEEKILNDNMDPVRAAREAAIQANKGIFPRSDWKEMNIDGKRVQVIGIRPDDATDGPPGSAIWVPLEDDEQSAGGGNTKQQSGAQGDTGSVAPPKPSAGARSPAAPAEQPQQSPMDRNLEGLTSQQEQEQAKLKASPEYRKRQLAQQTQQDQQYFDRQLDNRMGNMGLDKSGDPGEQYTQLAMSVTNVKNAINSKTLPEPRDVAASMQFAKGSGDESLMSLLQALVQKYPDHYADLAQQ